jgi:poly(A) polymerase
MRDLNLQPGKIIGELLEAIREAQAMGEVSTRNQALELARKRSL